MKESEEMHLKSVINESTLSTADAVPLPQWGRLRYEDTAFLALSERIHAYVEKKNNDGQSLPRVGKVASGASRIGFWRYKKERRRSSQVGDIDERGSVSSTPFARVPYPPLTRSPFPNGEGSDTRMPLSPHRQSEYMHMWKKNNDGQSLPHVGKVASEASRIGFWRYEREGRLSQVRHYTRAPERRPKRKPTPPRCARQPLPREGARVDTPSFLWKEVPRRGGGWMGIAVSSTQSLPRVGKVASGASRIGF